VSKKIYYKVCDVTSGELYSYAKYNIDLIDKSLCVHYIVDQWVYPNVKNTKLMVFKTLEDLQNFLNEDLDEQDGYKIYECEVINPTNKSIFISVKSAIYYWGDILIKLNKCMRLKNKGKKYLHLCQEPPKGTVFCSAVKLTKEVEVDLCV